MWKIKKLCQRAVWIRFGGYVGSTPVCVSSTPTFRVYRSEPVELIDLGEVAAASFALVRRIVTIAQLPNKTLLGKVPLW